MIKPIDIKLIIDLRQHFIEDLSIIRIKELVNVAWEPLSNEAWANYLSDFHTRQVYVLS